MKKRFINGIKNLLQINLNNECKVGEDSLKLYFSIKKDSSLYLRCIDINEKELGEFNLGNIFLNYSFPRKYPLHHQLLLDINEQFPFC